MLILNSARKFPIYFVVFKSLIYMN